MLLLSNTIQTEEQRGLTTSVKKCTSFDAGVTFFRTF